jgi:hypothetical protein
MSRKKHELVQRFIRKGEGVHITTMRTPVRNAAGETMEALSIDLSTAQVPERRYAADGFRVDIDSDMVRFIFGQRKPIGPELQSILLIRLPFLAVHQFLRSMKRGMEKTIRDYHTKFKVSATSALDLKDSPNQTVTLDANIVAAGFTAREACLDFYHVSPYVVLGMQTGGEMYADPVVRVILSSSNLLAMYDTLSANKSALPLDEMKEEDFEPI